MSGQWQNLLDALGEHRTDDAALLLAPAQHEQGNSQGNNPLIEGEESNKLGNSYVPERVWQRFQTDEWRTDFPPPPDFDGDETGEWETQGYSRTLTAAELAAVTAGNPDEEIVTLAQDEAERDVFFASLAEPAATQPEPPAAVTGLDEGITDPGEAP